jgi:hypothetical protein
MTHTSLPILESLESLHVGEQEQDTGSLLLSRNCEEQGESGEGKRQVALKWPVCDSRCLCLFIVCLTSSSCAVLLGARASLTCHVMSCV